MLRFAPRISPRLVDAVVRLDDHRVPIAEVSRRVGAEADRLGLTRPSYQRVRELVHESRRLRRFRVSPTRLLLEIAMRSRSPYELEHLVDGSARPLKR